MIKCIVTIAFMTLLCAPDAAQAANAAYLPLISTGPAPTTTYGVEWVRLWASGERSCQARMRTCRPGPTLQVDVFDVHGAGAAVQANSVQGRLNGVQVQGIHIDQQGIWTVETRSTGPASFDHGIALFTLQTHAIVRLIADADGAPVGSPVVIVSTKPTEIPLSTLIQAGYCPTEAVCQAWLATETVATNASWGIVFKRQV